MTTRQNKLWSGRFIQPTDEFVEQFTESVSFDRRLAKVDLQGSRAHASQLAKIGVLSADELQAILGGLDTIEQEIDRDEFEWTTQLEDVHMNIESRLTELIGDAGKKLHTGRSRNDQVATDLRLWLREEIDALVGLLDELALAIVTKAEGHEHTVMPGYTHLQTAQPIVFAHHLLAWYEMLERDRERFLDCRKRLNTIPLGSGALAGTTFPIDREFTRNELGFQEVSQNSLDAVSDRDFTIEFLGAGSMLSMHWSRWCEELVLWSSSAMQFVTLPDAYCTGSSIMPQKKNPDVPELIRGKCGRVIGNHTAALVLMKSQPLAYNRDNQEDKEVVFDTVDILQSGAQVLSGLIAEIQPNAGQMRQATASGHITATDLADWLVRQQVPFREAHELVGKCVALAEAEDKDLQELSLVQLRNLSAYFDEEALASLSVEVSVASRDHIGGTAPNQVRNQIARAKKLLAQRANS